ncbi:MAG: sugar ABC transporter permease [Clostridia bacterium]|nr:sugar ABC transporter permease [Clostridia bacterium]NLS84596.1 sugar ABC transporter permease [Oscillospiraceae bacterium]
MLHKKNKKLSRLIYNPNVEGYIFILPWLIGFFCFTLLPFIISFVLSFTDYNILEKETNFIGLANYIKLFTEDRLYLKSLAVTFKFALISVPLRLIFALAVAMILNRKTKAIPAYRVMYYLPSIIGGSVAVSVMWRNLFSKAGVFNSLLQLIGIPCEINWLSNTNTALYTLILLYVWQFGSAMLIFLSGLKQIPVTYYEAATVDGAGPVKQFFSITLPMLSPIILFNLVMQIINGFMVFTQAQIITNGGPVNETLVYVLYMYQKSFKYYDMGYGSAMAWILLVIIGFFTALVFKSSSQWAFYESETGASKQKKTRKERKK